MISPNDFDYIVTTPRAPATGRKATRQSWKLTPESKAAFQKEVDAIRQTYIQQAYHQTRQTHQTRNSST